jgi:peptidylprolyl isomerase
MPEPTSTESTPMVTPMNPAPSPRRAPRWFAAGLVVITLALVPTLAACSDSKSSASTATTDTTLPDAHTTSLDKVTVTGDFDTKPTVTFDTAYVGDSEESAVLIKGTGPVINAGQRITADYTAISGNDGSSLDTTYGQTATHIVLDEKTLLGPVYNAIVGQTVGSRVIVSADMTKSSGTWILFVFDITAAQDIPASASGTPVTPPADLPVVTIVDGVPTITAPTGTPPTTLISQVLIKGDGPVITAGQKVTMMYTGMIWASGKVFDSSWGATPVEFPVGTGQVIPGFDSGIVGQTVGSRVLLVIPPDQGYGASGNTQAGISGTDTLVFVVDLLLAS